MKAIRLHDSEISILHRYEAWNLFEEQSILLLTLLVLLLQKLDLRDIRRHLHHSCYFTVLVAYGSRIDDNPDLSAVQRVDFLLAPVPLAVMECPLYRTDFAFFGAVLVDLIAVTPRKIAEVLYEMLVGVHYV